MIVLLCIYFNYRIINLPYGCFADSRLRLSEIRFNNLIVKITNFKKINTKIAKLRVSEATVRQICFLIIIVFQSIILNNRIINLPYGCFADSRLRLSKIKFNNFIIKIENFNKIIVTS